MKQIFWKIKFKNIKSIIKTGGKEL